MERFLWSYGCLVFWAEALHCLNEKSAPPCMYVSSKNQLCFCFVFISSNLLQSLSQKHRSVIRRFLAPQPSNTRFKINIGRSCHLVIFRRFAQFNNFNPHSRAKLLNHLIKTKTYLYQLPLFCIWNRLDWKKLPDCFKAIVNNYQLYSAY